MITEPVVRCVTGNRKPDIAVVKGDTTYIVEATVSYESYKDSLKSAYTYKRLKYDNKEFKDQVNRMYSTSNVVVLPFVLGARGGWLPSNDSVLALFGLEIGVKAIIVNTVVQWSASLHKLYNATVWRVKSKKPYTPLK